MHRRDRRLNAIRPEAARRQGAFDERAAFRDQLAAPELAVLVLEQHQVAGGGAARRAARLLQEHQRQEADRLGLRQEVHQQAAEADRFAREIGAGQRVTGGSRVAFVENQVDGAQHRVEPLRQLLRPGHLIGNARIADLVLRPHDALRERRRRREKGARYLLCCQAAHFTQGQRDLRVVRKRRVAAGEDQAQPVVLDRFRLGRLLGGERLGMVLFQRIEARAAADRVDRLEAAGGDEPGARIRRHAFLRPLLERRAERFAQRLLGEVEIAEQPHQRRKDAARFRPVDGFDLFAHCLVGTRLCQDLPIKGGAMQRQSTKLRALLREQTFLHMPSVYDALGGRLVESLGYEAAYVGGYVTGGSTALTEPMVTMTEQVKLAGDIAQSIAIPLIVDGGAGFGEPLHTMRLVRECIRAGIAGAHIEDQLYPKRAHYHKYVVHGIPVEEYIDKIRFACKQRDESDPDFVVIARTDTCRALGLEEASMRINRAADAGADMGLLFPRNPAEAERAPKVCHLPLVYVQSRGNRDTRRPKVEFPRGACDCHAHIFERGMKLLPQTHFVPPVCPLPDYLKMLRTIGCERAVLVQASVNGTDNSAIAAAIKSGAFTL